MISQNIRYAAATPVPSPSPPSRPTFTQRIVEACASRPILTLSIAALCIILSIFSIRRARIDGSLSAMLKGESPAAESLGRLTSDYRSIDELLILAELPHDDTSSPDRARVTLVAFAQRLSAAIATSPEAAPLCRYVRHRPDESIDRFVRSVIIPNGLYYLNDDDFRQFLERLEPQEMSRQFTRNQSLISSPGPAAAGAAKAMLKDPLRLHEFLAGRMQSARLPAGLPTGLPSGENSLPLTESTASRGEFSLDSRSLLIRIGGNQPVSDLAFSKQFTSAIQNQITLAKPQGLLFHISGGYAIAAHTASSIRSDSISSTLGSIPLIPLLCWLLYRRLIAPLLITIAAGAGLLVAFGIHALFVPAITPLSAVIAATLAGLGIDYGIHTISHYQAARQEGLSSFQSSSLTARTVGTSLLAACFTTIFGFMSIYGAKVHMLRDFAILGSLGLILSLLAILTVMPALLCLIDRKPAKQSDNSRFRRAVSLIWITSITAAYPRRCIAISLIIAIIAATTILLSPTRFPKFESDLSVMHPRPSPPLDAALLIDDRFGTASESLLIELSAPTPDALISASYNVAESLNDAPSAAHISGTLGLSTLLPDPRSTGPGSDRALAIAAINVNHILASFDTQVARSIFDPAAFMPYREFLKTLLQPGPAPDMSDLLKEPELAAKLLPISFVESAQASPRHAMQLVRLNERIKDRSARESIVSTLRTALAPIDGATLTGLPVVGHDLEFATRRDLPRYIAISMALVVAWLIIIFRSVKDVLLAFIPVAFSVICMFGFMIAFDVRFNIASAMAVPLLAGIAVDTGIFLVVAARQHRTDGRAQLALAYRSTVQAIVGAAAMTVLGFGTLYWTSTPAIRSLGLTSVIGVTAGTFAALFLLMPLLLLLTPSRRPVPQATPPHKVPQDSAA